MSNGRRIPLTSFELITNGGVVFGQLKCWSTPLMVILLKTNRVGLDNVVSCRELVEIKGKVIL